MAREARLEARCCVLAVRMGVYAIKTGGFAIGLPDRLFLLPGGGCWLVEFKSRHGRLSPGQRHWFAQLAEIGHPVTVIRAYEPFVACLQERLPPQ